jgi:GMP synthase-like glutamine amidotransferase
MKRILVLQHVPHEHPGYIAEYARERGIALHVVQLWEPHTFPSLDGFDALIVLGGPMGVYEDFPSKNAELALIRSNLDHVPMLGICLGSQLMAHALGAAVHPNERDGRRLKEIGYYDIVLTEEGITSPLFAGFDESFKVLEWHGDIFDQPPGAEILASTPVAPHQAFSFQNVYGLLFHFEFTYEMVKNQLAVDAEWSHKDFALDDARLIAEAAQLAPVMKKQCYQLLNNFLSQ